MVKKIDQKKLSQAVTNLLHKVVVNNDDITRNWLGHEIGSGAAMIDALLLTGATMEALKFTRGGVYQHFRHLKSKFGLEWEKRRVLVKGKPVVIYAFKEVKVRFSK
jgi:transposase